MDEILELDSYLWIYDLGNRLEIVIQSLGLIGNLLALVVYSQPRLRCLSISLYIRCLSFCYLCENIRWFIFTYLNLKYTKSTFTCKFYNYLTDIFIPIGIWLEVFAGFDRLFTIVFPNRFKFIQTKRFKITTILIVVVFNLSFYSRYFFAFHLVKKTKDCLAISRQSLRLENSISSMMIPFCLMLISSIITLLGVLNTTRRMRSTMNRERSMSRTRRDMKFGVTLISMNLVFLVLVAPLNLIDEFKLFQIKSIYSFAILSNLLLVTFDSYFSLIFFVQLAVNSIVRKEFFKIIKLLFTLLKIFFKKII